ncbi:type IV pilin protein [Psychromonas ossibalaenae]|uniref:type IV pilin protein n=1 Tax=Psychromonas ossibalaenae TaxID=444922 RepID=UPI00036C41F4|nr:type IV pilin protein [Psychromonas ossibalaenae]
MKDKGFSLIELLIVIAIIGVLVGVAFPSYQSHIQKGNRVAAQLALTQIAQEFERESARQGDYPTGSAAAATIAAVDSPDSYTFTPTISTGDTFEITAAPVTGSISENDECGTLSINQTGETTDDSSNDCW